MDPKRGGRHIVLDRRFQRPAPAVKTEILRLIGLSGNFTGASFDLVMTRRLAPPLTMANVSSWIDEISLIEMKTTAKPIRSKALAGFFFGSSETQYHLSEAAADRILWAFVVLNDANDYVRPFCTLLTFEKVRSSVGLPIPVSPAARALQGGAERQRPSGGRCPRQRHAASSW